MADAQAVVPHKGKKGAKLPPLPSLEACQDKLQWHVESTHRLGRYAVADADLPAGTLVLLERPLLSLPMTKFASVVCHRCLAALPQAQGRDGAPAPGANPCLPRYCPPCRAAGAGALDAQLAALRIKLPELSAAHQIDPTMLHILLLLDLQRSGLPAGAPPGARGAGKAEVRCGVADADALPNLWARKPEGWRKKVGAAVRSLHTELLALAAAVPGYSPSGVPRLQADAAQMSLQVQTISAPGPGPDTGVALFPALGVFPHSCLPNCFFLARGAALHVRAIVDVPKGTPLTVAYTGLTEPRAHRQAALEAERHTTCACPRCTQPMADSTDKWLEGTLCQSCLGDVMLPVPEGPEAAAAAEDYKARLRLERAAIEKKAAKRKGGGKAKAGPAAPKAPAADGEAAAAAADPDSPLPEGVSFWRCCAPACAAVEAANTVTGTGPADVCNRAARSVQEAMVLVNTKHPQLVAQGEAALVSLAGAMEGRLSPYHHRVIDALTPLINLSIRKSEPQAVIAHAVQLWNLEREVLQHRPTVQQLQCLEAVIDAAEHKAGATSSDAIKRRFEKKVKEAKEQRAVVRRVLLGQ